MKYLYLFFAFIFFQEIGFSQKQLSHFVYPTDTVSNDNSTYSFIDNQDAIFLTNNSGAYIIAQGQTSFEPVKISDSLNAKEFVFFEKTKKGQGFLVVKDPYGNYHVGGGDIFKPSFFFQISGQVSYKPIFKVIEGNILFTDEGKLYSADIDGNMRVMAEMPLIKSFAFDGKDLALLNQMNFLYNETTVDLNKVWQNDYANVSLKFFKNSLYAFTSSICWFIEKRPSGIKSKKLFSANSLKLNVRNDSLILTETTNSLPMTYYVSGSKLLVIPNHPSQSETYSKKWQGDSLEINIYCSSFLYGCIDDILNLTDKKKADSATKTLLLRNYQNEKTQEPLKSGIKYLGARKSVYFFIYLNQYGTKKLIIYNRNSYKITSHNLARLIENQSLIFETEDFNLSKLDLKTLDIQQFSQIFKKFVTKEIPTFFSFQIGNKNFGYESNFGELYLYENFENNVTPKSYFSKANQLKTSIFFNDTIYKIPTQKTFYPRYSILHSNNLESDFFIDHSNDSLNFIDLKTQHNFRVYLKNATLATPIFISTDNTLYAIADNSLYYLNEQKFILIKEGLQVYYHKVLNNKIWLIYTLNQKQHLALIEDTSFKDIKVFEGFVQDFYSNQNDIFLLENLNMENKIWTIDEKGLAVFPKFWNNYIGNSINFEYEDLKVITYDKDIKKEIYSSEFPLKPIAVIPNQINQYDRINEIDSTLYFSAIVSSLHPVSTNNSNTPRYLIKFESKSKKFFYLKSNLLLDVKRIESIGNRIRIFGPKYPYEQILIDRSGPSHLTEGFSKIYESKVKDNRIYVFGSYLNQPPQLYELNSSKPFDFEWIEIKDQPIFPNPEVPTDFGKIIVYPNPVIDDFDIKYQHVPGIYHIAIFNADGKKMYFQHAGDIIDQYENTYLSSEYLILEKSRRQNITDIIKSEILSYPSGTYYLTFYFDAYQWKKQSTTKILKISN